MKLPPQNAWLLFAKLLLIVFPLGQLSRVALPFADVNLYYHDLLVAVLWLIYPQVLINQLQGTKIWGFIVFAGLGLWLALDTLAPHYLLVSSLYFVRLIAYLGVFLALRIHLKNEKSRLYPYILITIFSSVWFAWIQYGWFPQLESLFYLGWDRHAYRIVGAWLDPNFTGLLFVLFTLWLINSAPPKMLPRLGSWALAIACFVTVLFTYSRSSYLALITGLGVYAWKQGYRWLLVTALILGLCLLPWLPRKTGEGTKLERTSTIVARLTSWKMDSVAVIAKPLFGYGFNTLRYTVNRLEANPIISHSSAGSDNSLLYLLLTLGVFGTLQFFSLGNFLVGKRWREPLILSSLSAIAVHGMFVNSWVYPWVIWWVFWLLL